MSEHKVHVSVISWGPRSKFFKVWCEAADLDREPKSLEAAEALAEQHRKEISNGRD
jgi:hypothetical protein